MKSYGISKQRHQKNSEKKILELRGDKLKPEIRFAELLEHEVLKITIIYDGPESVLYTFHLLAHSNLQ